MTLPNCRLFLVVSAGGDADSLAACLSAAIEAGDVASLLVRQAAQGQKLQHVAERLLPIAQSGNAAVLLDERSELASQLNADGVEVSTDLQVYKACRSRLGPDMVVGTRCGGNRHKAMEMAEAGADYVRIDPFAAGPDGETLINWWSQLFEVPCVAAGPLEPAEMAKIVAQGADFVQPSDDMWTSPKMASQVVADSMKAIEAASK